MRTVTRNLIQFDWLLMGAVLLLITFGLLSLFSLSEIGTLRFFERQLLWVVLGLVILVSASFVDFRLFRTQTFAVLAFYGLTVFLLSAVLFLGFRVRGVEGWLTFGGLFFQPVEVAKLALVILLAKFFSKRHVEIYRLQHLVVSGIYAAVPTILVLIQPDLGSAIILFSIWFSIIIFSGIKKRHFLLLILVLIFVGAFGWHAVLQPYQKSRITTFLNPYNDPKGAGYQMIQAMIAVGSGKVWGKGLGYGSQSHLNFLPEAETDFIFAAFAEEWGFLGIAALLGILSLLLWRIVRIGERCTDNFSRLYAFGFAAFIFTQSFIHIGMNMGLLPITGITLPFVSYGGSSLVSLLAGVGILQNINIVNQRRKIGVVEM